MAERCLELLCRLQASEILEAVDKPELRIEVPPEINRVVEGAHLFSQSPASISVVLPSGTPSQLSTFWHRLFGSTQSPRQVNFDKVLTLNQGTQSILGSITHQ